MAFPLENLIIPAIVGGLAAYLTDRIKVAVQGNDIEHIEKGQERLEKQVDRLDEKIEKIRERCMQMLPSERPRPE
jgi:ubiquinone biosynthesis protein UbiJ